MFNIQQILNKELLGGFYEILEISDTECLIAIEYIDDTDNEKKVTLNFVGLGPKWSFFVEKETKEIVDVEFPKIMVRKHLNKLVCKKISAGDKYGFTTVKNGVTNQCGFYADKLTIE